MKSRSFTFTLSSPLSETKVNRWYKMRNGPYPKLDRVAVCERARARGSHHFWPWPPFCAVTSLMAAACYSICALLSHAPAYLKYTSTVHPVAHFLPPPWFGNGFNPPGCRFDSLLQNVILPSLSSTDLAYALTPAKCVWYSSAARAFIDTW